MMIIELLRFLHDLQIIFAFLSNGIININHGESSAKLRW
jgi:hypothetical protein